MAALPALGVGVFAALRESLATVVTYAYSRRELSSQWVDSPFLETAQQQAERACIEMAALGRALVWVQPAPKMSKEYIKREGTSPECAPIGWIDTTSGVRADLTALEAFNKIIHAASFDWGFDGGGNPLLVCHCPEAEQAQHKWVRASIRITNLVQWWAGRSV
jgi:hypothetical protein